jgi:hypothetical protein
MKCRMKLSERLVIALSVALCVTLTACSSGANSGVHHSHSPAPAGQPTTGPAAVALVKSHWLEIFDGLVPIPLRLRLLQNGPEFAAFVHSQEKTSIGQLVLQASAKVSSVTVHPHGLATVVFTILLAGKPLKSNITGTAVFTGGTWKIAASTFCGLLYLAYGKKSHLIPHACQG